MRVQDLVTSLGIKVVSMTKAGGGREVAGGFVGDVLSHVLAKARINDVWITVQTHENVVAVASLLDLACVIVCQREVPNETEKRARSEGVVVLWSEDGAFEMAGRVRELLGASQARG